MHNLNINTLGSVTFFIFKQHHRFKEKIFCFFSAVPDCFLKDCFTGMYNEKGIKKIITQLKHENADNLYFVLIQTYLNKDLIFDEERNQKDKAISFFL